MLNALKPSELMDQLWKDKGRYDTIANYTDLNINRVMADLRERVETVLATAGGGQA